MLEINLDELKNGLPTLTKSVGSFYADAGKYCLLGANHKSGVIFSIEGDNKSEVTLLWNCSQEDLKKFPYTFGDKQEAIEYGATGIAILLVKKIENYDSVERSYKGTGFDYWAGKTENSNEELLFDKKLRLEISGIAEESESNTVQKRVKIKQKQVSISDGTNIPSCVIIVEFGTPFGNISKNGKN